jgi:hypothetical protein
VIAIAAKVSGTFSGFLQTTNPQTMPTSGTAHAESGTYSNHDRKGEHIMPYILGWLLGVPVIVLVILYLIFH